jgi:hypothetical protein
MSWTRRRLQFVTAGLVVFAWALVYIGVITLAPPAYDPAVETATKMNIGVAVMLAIPTAVYVVAALLVLHHWLAAGGARLAATDSPGRMLAAAVAMLPEHRRDWGAAMTAELAEVRGRPQRWRFALSSVWAALRLPPAAGRLTLIVIAGAAVAATVLAGPAIDAAVPGLDLFAVFFVGLTGALAVLAAARSRTRRMRFPAPVASLVVIGSVAAAITMTVVLLVREPSTADHLSPPRAVLLAAVLAGSLWVARATPRALGTDRLAPHLGAGAAVLYVAVTMLAIRISTDTRIEPDVREAVTALIAMGIFFGSAALFFVPAFWAAMARRSFRSGIQAGAWTAIANLPLAYAMSVNEALRIYANGGGVGFDHLAGPVGVILDDAVFWRLFFDPVVGIPCAVFGAAIGATFASYNPVTRQA